MVDLDPLDNLKQESIDMLERAKHDERFGLTMYTMR